MGKRNYFKRNVRACSKSQWRLAKHMKDSRENWEP